MGRFLGYDVTMENAFYNPAYTRTPRVAEQCGDLDTETMLEACVKSIILPVDILQQLRMQNIMVDFLNQGEIEDIIQACKYDGTLVDDPDGLTFRDQMSLTPAEKKQGHGKHALPLWYHHEKQDDDDKLALGM